MDWTKLITHALLIWLLFIPPFYLFSSLLQTSLGALLEYLTFSLGRRAMLIFLNTVVISLCVSLVSCLIGFFLSVLLEYSNLPLKNFFRFALFTPFLVPPYIFTFAWMGFLGKRGSFSQFVFPNLPINIYNPFALIGFLSLSFFPLAMLIISLGMRNVDRNLIDAGRVINNKKIVRKIILPLVKPHLLTACFFVFVLSFSEYVVPAFLRLNTYAGEVFAQLAAFYNLRRAIVYSVPILLIAFGFSSLFLVYSKKSIETLTSFSREKKEFISLSFGKKFICYLALFMLLALSLLVPIWMMVLESELNILDAISSASSPILNSIGLSASSSLFVTTIGFLTCYSIRSSKILVASISFPLAIASPVIGISLINLYSSTPLYNTLLMPILGYALRFLPFSIFIFLAFFPQVQKNLEEAARIGKAKTSKILRKIFLPLVKGGFLSSFTLILILCLGEIGITQMLAPPGFQTLAMRIETLMHYGNYPHVMSLSIFMLTLIFAVYGVHIWVYKHERGSY